ncbi:putative membrane protein [Enterobacteriaceae bacterium ATCC 29904]|nr:putative membrane protein [Enterobacteriaceae bacterium ATCC 29904]
MRELTMKILLWVILVIFLIGLLVVTGVFKMIF